MKRLIRLFAKCKKGFTLMECIVALAVVGIFSALMLPLLSTAMHSFKVSNEVRETASSAAKKNATAKTETADETKLYVTVEYEEITTAASEKVLTFTKSEVSGDYSVTITYYDLKYGKESK